MEILKELDPDNITIHSLAIKRAARLNIFKDRYESMMMVNTQEHMDLLPNTVIRWDSLRIICTVRKEWREIWKTLDMPSRARQGV